MTKYAGKAPYPFTPGDNSTGQCSVCGEVFYGDRAFDKHIRGEYPDRGCIDPVDPPRRKDGTPESWWLDDRARWHFGHRMSEQEKSRRRAARSGHQSSSPTDSGASTRLLGVPVRVGASEASEGRNDA